MTRKKEEVYINPKVFLRHGMLIERVRGAEIDLAKEIYDAWYEQKELWSMASYLRILYAYYPTNTYHYYRILFEIYRYFVVDHGFRPSDLYSIDKWDLYNIKSTKKGVFDKYTLLDTIKYFGDMRLTRKQRKSHLWELRNRRLSLTSTIQNLQKKYDVDVVEKFSLIHEASKTDADQIA